VKGKTSSTKEEEKNIRGHLLGKAFPAIFTRCFIENTQRRMGRGGKKRIMMKKKRSSLKKRKEET